MVSEKKNFEVFPFISLWELMSQFGSNWPTEEKTFEEFRYMGLCETSDPWGGAISGPRAKI